MFTLNPENTLLFNVGVDLFAAIYILIIYYSYRRFFSPSYETQIICQLNLSLFFVLLADLGTWVLDGRGGPALRFAIYGMEFAYYIMFIITVGAWVKYSYYCVYNEIMPYKRRIWLLHLPFVLFLIFLLTTPWSRWCFYLDTVNRYHRGSLALPFYAIILAYLMMVTVVSLLHYRKEKSVDRKEELLMIALFAMPVMVGTVAQTLLYGLSLEWPCAAIFSLLIILSKARQSISQDPLTGLNNRRNLDRYLSAYSPMRPITAVMLDINQFKYINDHHGHRAGDSALVRTANILRSACAETPAFLARYGGDEFILILPFGQTAKIEPMIGSLRSAFEKANQTSELPFSIQPSIGFASVPLATPDAIMACIKMADENMYREKEIFHGSSTQDELIHSGRNKHAEEK